MKSSELDPRFRWDDDSISGFFIENLQPQVIPMC